jgi:parvulin-like peptidyl-prolyl isomerase
MKDRTLMVLGIVAGLLVVLSIWVEYAGSPRTTPTDRTGTYLVSKLDPNRIARIVVRSVDETVELDRQGRGYVLTSRLSYPASTKAVNRLVNDVLKIRTSGKQTENASAHEALGVVEGGKDSTTVEFLDTEGQRLVGLVVGQSVEGEQGYYVRRLGEDTVYRTADWVSLRASNLTYLEKELVNNERNRIAKVTVERTGEEPYALVRQEGEDAQVEMLDMPEGKQFKGRTYDGVFGASSYLNFNDFESAAKKQDLTLDGRYVVETHDGARYIFEIAKVEAEAPADGEEEAQPTYWVRASAKYVGPKNIDVVGLSEEETAKTAAFVESEKAVRSFNERHQSWVYELPSYKAESMLKPRDELIEDVPEGPTEIAARHILISYEGAERSSVTGRTKDEARARAAEVLQRVLAEPEKFADLAKEYSDGPSGPQGGDLGTFTREKMTKAFSDAAFALEVDGIAQEPVETEFGFHIIQRTR